MTWRGLPAVLLLAAVPWTNNVASAEPDGLRLSGYLEHQFSLSETPSGWSQTEHDRLRVDFDGQGGRGVSASAAVVWQVYRGRISADLADLVPAAVRDQTPRDVTLTTDDRQFLNHARISLYAGPFTIVAGKQHLVWGRGLVFNPTELFRPKMLFDPGYEREGVGAVTAAMEAGILSDVAFVYVPGKSWRTSAKVARVRSHVAGFDVSALAAEIWEDDPVAKLVDGVPAVERRRTLGGDFSGELFHMGLWGEGTWSASGDLRWTELTVGGNTTLAGNVLLSIEGYLDGRGEWRDPYPVDDWLAVASGARRTIGRSLVFASLSRAAGNLLTLDVSALGNVGDRSVAVLPSADYSFAENVGLFLQFAFALGPDGTEFGTRGHVGLIRGRVYF